MRQYQVRLLQLLLLAVHLLQQLLRAPQQQRLRLVPTLVLHSCGPSHAIFPWPHPAASPHHATDSNPIAAPCPATVPSCAPSASMPPAMRLRRGRVQHRRLVQVLQVLRVVLRLLRAAPGKHRLYRRPAQPHLLVIRCRG